jgi:HTH-type transcriptional regulator, sugar sensing transcriptional regulator
MDITSLLQDFAFSKYESSCYLALLSQHPCNGSQLSKLSGIARSRIYDVLRGLTRKGVVFEIEKGLYVPLPFEELKKRLQTQFESNLSLLEKQVARLTPDTDYEYLLTIQGQKEAIAKAIDIIDAAREEIYLRLFPDSWKRLEKSIRKALRRGVGIRLIGMGTLPQICDIQVTHPEVASLPDKLGGESIDIIVDRAEALVGIFEPGQEATSPVIWTRNRWFVIANRDSLRHDFYHYFLDKLHDRQAPLSPQDEAIYAFIKKDD